MTNGAWQKHLESIRAALEPALLTQVLLPDDFLPARGRARIKTTIDWHVMVSPLKVTGWSLNGEPAIGIKLTQDGCQAGFGSTDGIVLTSQRLDVGNWLGMRHVRQLMFDIAGEIQRVNMTVNVMGRPVAPAGDFLIRSRAEISAHALLAMQSALEAKR